AGEDPCHGLLSAEFRREGVGADAFPCWRLAAGLLCALPLAPSVELSGPTHAGHVVAGDMHHSIDLELAHEVVDPDAGQEKGRSDLRDRHVALLEQGLDPVDPQLVAAQIHSFITPRHAAAPARIFAPPNRKWAY